jgi:hypothetical protein
MVANIQPVFSFFVAVFFYIYGFVAILIYRYLTSNEPVEITLPLIITNPMLGMLSNFLNILVKKH